MLRAGAKPVADLLRDNLAKLGGSGKGAASVRVGTNSRNGVVKAIIKAGSKEAWYLGWVERGTKPHLIKPRRRKSLFIAGLMREVIEHPGAKPKPFMRPALDQRRDEALQAMGTYARKRLANKHGIDLPDPDVSPDDVDTPA